MARALTKTIKSINIGVIKHSSNDGTHDKGYVFGSTVTVSSATNGRILTVVGSTADVTESWTLTLLVPEKMKFFRTTGVTTSAGGAVTGAHYSDAIDVDGNQVVTFIADAEDTGGAIANGEDVTITWQAHDSTTLDATMFSVKCQSDNSGHSSTIKVRFVEDGTLHTMTLFSGDTISGPFAELEVDALSNSAASCFVYYQEH